MILEGSGRDFDPDLVSAFLACEERFLDAARQSGGLRGTSVAQPCGQAPAEV